VNSDNYKQKQPLVNANVTEKKSIKMQKSYIHKQKKWIYYIEERRKEVAQMLAQGHSETEIAQILHVHVSTICRDVKVLKELSQRFVFDLAKGDLTYYYKQCIDGMDEIRREAWSLYKYGDWSQGVHLTVKEKIAALRLLKECNEAKFALLEKGPSVLNVKGMEEKLENIQSKQISQQSNNGLS
jgi:hypothetical protein